MASYEKGKYSYSYNGKENTIYYNQAETDAAFKQISLICGDVLDYSSDTKTADKCFDGFPSKYSDLFPNHYHVLCLIVQYQPLDYIH